MYSQYIDVNIWYNGWYMEWLCWTRDLGVWGSIPAELVMGKYWIHTNSVHPEVFRTRWNEKLVLCEWLQLQKMRCILTREVRLWQCDFQHLVVNDVVRWAFRDIWTIYNYFYLYLFYMTETTSISGMYPQRVWGSIPSNDNSYEPEASFSPLIASLHNGQLTI